MNWTKQVWMIIATISTGIIVLIGVNELYKKRNEIKAKLHSTKGKVSGMASRGWHAGRSSMDNLRHTERPEPDLPTI